MDGTNRLVLGVDPDDPEDIHIDGPATVRVAGRPGRLRLVIDAPPSTRVTRDRMRHGAGPDGPAGDAPRRPLRRLRVDRGHPGGRRER